MVQQSARRTHYDLRFFTQAKLSFIIAFCNTKTRADKLFAALKAKGKKAALLHGDLQLLLNILTAV